MATTARPAAVTVTAVLAVVVLALCAPVALFVS